MRSIQEAGPGELAATKRRTIKTLAMGGITEEQCKIINKHLDAAVAAIEATKEGDR